MFDLIALQIAAVTLYASLWFLVALRLRRNDVADVAWGGSRCTHQVSDELARHSHELDDGDPTVGSSYWLRGRAVAGAIPAWASYPAL